MVMISAIGVGPVQITDLLLASPGPPSKMEPDLAVELHDRWTIVKTDAMRSEIPRLFCQYAW